MLSNRLSQKFYTDLDLVKSILKPYLRYANSDYLEEYFEDKLSKVRTPETRKQLLLEKKELALELKQFWQLWHNGEPIPESCICAVQKEEEEKKHATPYAVPLSTRSAELEIFCY